MLARLICAVVGHRPWRMYRVEGIQTSFEGGEVVTPEWIELACPRCGTVRATGIDVDMEEDQWKTAQ